MTSAPPSPAPPSSGKTYYVATNGDDSRSCDEATDINTPKKTVSNVLSSGCLSPGDTLYIRGGTYAGEGWQSVSGSPGNPITISSYPGETAVYDGYLGYSNFGAPDLRVIEMCCSVVHDLVINGLEITSSDPIIDEMKRLDMSNPTDLATWKNVYMPNPRNSYTPFVFNGTGYNERIVISNNYVHHLTAGGMCASGDQIKIINNRIMDTAGTRSAYGCYATMTNSLIKGNIYDHTTYGLHLYDGSSNPGNTANTVFEDNIFSNIGRDTNGHTAWYHYSSGLVANGGVAILIANDGGGNIIRNNQFVNNAGSGVSLWNPNNDTIEYNTFYGNAAGEEWNAVTAVWSPAGPDSLLRNNIFYNNASDMHITGNMTIDHNLIGTDPLFVNPPADFHLQPSSPGKTASDTGGEAGAYGNGNTYVGPDCTGNGSGSGDSGGNPQCQSGTGTPAPLPSSSLTQSPNTSGIPALSPLLPTNPGNPPQQGQPGGGGGGGGGLGGIFQQIINLIIQLLQQLFGGQNQNRQ
jgi:hypothetical protein